MRVLHSRRETDMTLDEFVSKGWQDHATDAEGVLARLPEGAALVQQLMETATYVAQREPRLSARHPVRG